MKPHIIYCIDCGSPRLTSCPTTIRCEACQKEADQQRIERWKDKIKGSVERDLGYQGGKQTKCKCPTCVKIHKRVLNWTGRGMPRVYCNACIRLVADYAYEQESRYGLSL